MGRIFWLRSDESELLATLAFPITNIASPRRKLLAQVCFEVDDLRHGLFGGGCGFGFHIVKKVKVDFTR